MNITEPTTIILILESIVHLVTIGLIVTRRSIRDRSISQLLVYVLFSLLWTLSQALTLLGWMGMLFVEPAVRQIPFYSLFILALLFLQLSRSFLRLQGRDWVWWVGGIAWAAVTLALDIGLRIFPEGPLAGLQPDRMVPVLLLLGTAAPIVAAGAFTFRAHRHATEPLHRNRIAYWSWVLILIVVGSALLYIGYSGAGSALCLLATPVAAYVVLAHRLPAARQHTRRMLGYCITICLSTAIYVGGVLGMQCAFQAVPGYDPLIPGAAMALALALIFYPLLSLVQRLVNRLIAGTGYDLGRIAREYRRRISNIVDLERLVEVIAEEIGEALGIQRIVLFVVRPGSGSDSPVCLENVRRPGEEEVMRGTLMPDSPLTEGLQEDRRPLIRPAIGLPLGSQEAPAELRSWLSDLGLDVYVPIHAQGEWIGLLALGAKRSGKRYLDEDLELLGTLADQTAAVLENALLMQGLQRTNADLRRACVDLEQRNDEMARAYRDLETANQRLREMDRLTSGFIGTIDDELRTPFANLRFSLQLLERYGVDGWSVDQRDQLAQLKEEIGQATQIVDSLVTFATLLGNADGLQVQDLDAAALIESALHPLRPLATKKGLDLHTEIPAALPPVKGDRERLVDAVYHLAHEAIRFTGTGGKVRVRCRTEAGAMQFEVEDSGVGVSPERFDALWNGITQVGSSLHRGVGEPGLGLAVVHLVVRAHGGRVYAEIEEGKGCTFGFCIPLDGVDTTWTGPFPPAPEAPGQR